jgi:uncharacterized protein (DUF58 family)
MTRSRLKKIFFLLKRVGFYLPVTLYFILFGVATVLGYRWLHNAAAVPDSSYKDVFKLLLSLALFVGSCVLCLGMISVCVSFLFFKWKERKTGITLRITTSPSGNGAENKQTVSLYIHPILQPLLGYIRIRLNYDQAHFSEKFNIVRHGKIKLVRTTLEGEYTWDLPGIREYRVEKAILYFEDFFQFFSFATPVSASESFYTPPQARLLEQIDASPRKTEEQTIRIEELKKAEGEYINYKNFESNDDVRRIVWKIYAKNKELVVRIPEILDPYASHVYLYASFFSKFQGQGSEVIEVPFLNYYKTICWSVYEQFIKKGFEVRYIPDQEIPQQNIPLEEDRVKYSITLSAWQKETDLKTYLDLKNATVVLLTSLSDPEQVNELAEKYGNVISFVFVPLTESLNDLQLAHWLQWIFVQQEKDKTAAYRASWNLSALRLKIEQNEKELSKILKDNQKSVVL